jgi:hypothetical protein
MITAALVQIPIHHLEVRILPPQPPIPTFGQASQETRERAGNPGFSRIRFCLQTPNSPILGRQLPKVSSHDRENSRFAETTGGDLVRSRLPPDGGSQSGAPRKKTLIRFRESRRPPSDSL